MSQVSVQDVTAQSPEDEWEEIKSETKPEKSAGSEQKTTTVPETDKKKDDPIPDQKKAILPAPIEASRPPPLAPTTTCERCISREKWLDRSAESIKSLNSKVKDLEADVAKWKMAYAELHLAQQTQPKPANPVVASSEVKGKSETTDGPRPNEGSSDHDVARKRIKREMVPLNKRGESDLAYCYIHMLRVWWDKWGYSRLYEDVVPSRELVTYYPVEIRWK